MFSSVSLKRNEQKAPDPAYVIHTDIGVSCLLFSETCNFLYSGDIEGKVTKWNTTFFRAENSFEASTDRINSLHEIQCSTEVKLLVQDKLGRYSLWLEDREIWTPVWTRDADCVSFCRCTVTDSMLAVPLAKGGLAVWRVDTGEPIISKGELKEKTGELMTVRYLKKDSKSRTYYFVVGAESGVIFLVKLLLSSEIKASLGLNKTKESSTSSEEDGTVTTLECCESCVQVDGTVMALGVLQRTGDVMVGGESCNIRNILVKGESFTEGNRSTTVPFTGIGAVLYCDVPSGEGDNPNVRGRILAAGAWDGSIIFQIGNSVETTPLHRLSAHDAAIQDLVLNDTSCLLAAGCKDGRISFWDTRPLIPLTYKEQMLAMKCQKWVDDPAHPY